ncbi:hypothetical protein KY285_012230 [Solanum tuberosum]|nr:hypothetical protein KY289_011012 [Solanum tuberosum]KAH0736523.1 hypothetical protein KY285_012230 [Solanum tuberosum]
MDVEFELEDNMLMHSSNHKFDRPGEAEASIQKRRSNNYSQVSDGAAAVLLMKRSIAMQKGLPILGVFRYTLCITKKYCKMLTLEILTSSTAHSLSSTIFASPGPKKIVGVFSKANEYAEMNYHFLGCAENALGIREWLDSKGHQYIVTPEKEGPDCGGIGSDHVDLKAAAATGLTVAEVTGSNTVSVAD